MTNPTTRVITVALVAVLALSMVGTGVAHTGYSGPTDDTQEQMEIDLDLDFSANQFISDLFGGNSPFDSDSPFDNKWFDDDDDSSENDEHSDDEDNSSDEDSSDDSDEDSTDESDDSDEGSTDESDDSDEDSTDESDESDDSESDDSEDQNETDNQDDDVTDDDGTDDQTDENSGDDSTETGDSDETGLDVEAVERAVHEAVNQERAAHGVNELDFDTELQEIARGHSQDMAERDYFSHTDPEGDNFADRYEEHGYQCHVNGYTGGENIAQTWFDRPVSTDSGTVHYETEQELGYGIVDMWMNSPGHRENLLGDQWENEGIGIHVTDNGKVYATQNFC